MSEPLIWTCEDIVRFTYEPDFYDRSWAWCWLQRHHPAEASRHAARAIRDPSPSVVCSGLDAFAASPTAEARDAIEELKTRGDLGPSVQERLDGLEHPERKKRFHDPLDDAIERLSRQHAELRREAPSMLRSRRIDPRLIALGALGNQQHQWATDILVDALPVMLTKDDPTIVWDTLDALRDPRSLPAIAASQVCTSGFIGSRAVGIRSPAASLSTRKRSGSAARPGSRPERRTPRRRSSAPGACSCDARRADGRASTSSRRRRSRA